MGLVFYGETPGGRPVAVKIIKPEFASDLDFRERFAREVAAARKVGGFYTAAVVDASPEANPPWMVTSYIAGSPLSVAVKEEGTFSAPDVRRLGAALAEGLKAIHACGLVHRDFKPANIIIAADGPRIIDFGVAKSVSMTTITQRGVQIGTPQFMSPEHFGSGIIGPKSDVFSLGEVLVFAATGHSPFDAREYTAVMGRVLYQNPDLSGLPASLHAVVGACLAKDPAARPSLDALVADFSQAGSRPAAHRGNVSGPMVRYTPPAAVPLPPLPRQQPEPERQAREDRLARLVAAVVGQVPDLAPVAPRLDAGERIDDVKFSPDGRLCAIASHDKAIRMWNTDSWRTCSNVCVIEKLVNDEDVGAVRLGFTADGTHLSASWSDRFGPSRRIHRWRIRSGRMTGEDDFVLTSEGFDPVISPDGRYGVAIRDGDLLLWNLEEKTYSVLWAKIQDAFNPDNPFNAVFAADGRIVAMAGIPDGAHVWDAATGVQVGVLGPPTGEGLGIKLVRFSGDGRLAAGLARRIGKSYLCSLCLWAGGPSGWSEKPSLLQDKVKETSRVEFADGRRVAVLENPEAVYGSTALLLDVDSRRTCTLRLKLNSYSSLEKFSPDGRMLVQFEGGCMHLWDTETLRLAASEYRPVLGGRISDVVFSPDSRLLVTVEGSVARVWGIPEQDALG